MLRVRQGDKIALPDPKRDPQHPENIHYSTHWEFASVSPLRDPKGEVRVLFKVRPTYVMTFGPPPTS